MALDINGATIGYDQNGIQSLIRELNIEVFDAAKTTINVAVPVLQAEITGIWAGQSADAFKEKLHRDSENVIKALNALEEGLKGEFAQIAQNVDNYDASMAEKIKSAQ